MKDDDEQPTAEEQREAEALAAALAGERAPGAPPPEALETAALLRYARGGELAPERQAAVAERVRPALRPRPRRRVWAWLVAPAALGLMSLTLLFTRARAPRSGFAPSAVALPAPSAALLAAQAQAARRDPRSLAALDAQMRAYRRALYADLRGEGGGR